MGIEAIKRFKEVGPLDDARLRDLEKRGDRYLFNIGGSDRGFKDALSAVKIAFDWKHGEREWLPDEKMWSVPATSESEEKLCAIFGNAEDAFRALHSQIPMFDNAGAPPQEEEDDEYEGWGEDDYGGDW